MIQSNSHFRARTKAFELAINILLPKGDGKKNSPRELLKQGFIHPDIEGQMDSLTNQNDFHDNAPLSFTEVTSYSTWFAMHPEKICGTEQITTSMFFPVKVVGTEKEIVDTIHKSIEAIKQKVQPLRTPKKADNAFEFELKLLELELGLEFEFNSTMDAETAIEKALLTRGIVKRILSFQENDKVILAKDLNAKPVIIESINYQQNEVRVKSGTSKHDHSGNVIAIKASDKDKLAGIKPAYLNVFLLMPPRWGSKAVAYEVFPQKPEIIQSYWELSNLILSQYNVGDHVTYMQRKVELTKKLQEDGNTYFEGVYLDEPPSFAHYTDKQRKGDQLVLSGLAADALIKEEGLGLPFQIDQYNFEFIPKAKLNVVGKSNNLTWLKRNVNEWLEANVRNRKFLNKHTGYEVIINKDAIGKWFSGNAGTMKVKAYTAIEDIIKVAIKIDEKPDTKQRSDVKTFHYFVSVVSVEKATYPFLFTVKETKDHKFIYNNKFIPTKKRLLKTTSL